MTNKKIMSCKICEEKGSHTFVKFQEATGYVWYCENCGATIPDEDMKKLKREIWMRNYQKEYHRKPEMMGYMKNYHADPVNKTKAKERRNTPEQKEKSKATAKKWRESAKGKAWMRKYRAEHKEQVRSSLRKYYHNTKNVKTEYNTKHSKERQDA